MLTLSATRMILAAFVAALLTACAGANYRPLIDSQSIDMNKYESDLKQCQQYATQTGDAAQKAVVGAAAGAVFGALLAAAGGNRYDQDASAKIGLITGAASGGLQGETDQRNIIKNCLSGRGYRVLQ